MRYSKVLKLGAVGLALLLIPRRSSRQVKQNMTPDFPLNAEREDSLKSDVEPTNNTPNIDSSAPN